MSNTVSCRIAVRAFLLAGTTSLGLICATSASAQQAQTPAEPSAAQAADSGIADIVVTAQRRSESSQSVPVAISALDQKALTRVGFVEAADVASVVPSVQVQEVYGRFQPIFSVRGISESSYTANQSSPVGVYADEAYIGETFLHGANFFDVERVEVLKGPQGTLYGKNTTGGAISLISRAPKIDDGIHANATVGYGNYDAVNIEAGAEGTLVPGKLALRVAGFFTDDEGYQRIVNLGKRAGQTHGGGLRATLVFKPIDDLKFVFRYTHTEVNQAPPMAQSIGVYPLGPGGALVDFGGYSRSSTLGPRDFESNNPDQNLHILFDMFTLTSTINLPHFDIVSVTSYHTAKKRFYVDLDGGLSAVDDTDYNNDTSAFSQDLRLVTTGTGPLKFIGGLYYDYERNAQDNTYWLYHSPLNGVHSALIASGIDAATAAYITDFYQQFGMADLKQTLTHRSYAAYSELHWDVTHKIGLTAGIRFTHDRDAEPYYNVSRYASRGGAPLGTWIPGNTTAGTANPIDAAFTPDFTAYTDGPYTTNSAPFLAVDNNRVTGKVTLDYKPFERVLVYATYSRGYRSGNFNGGLHYLFTDLSQPGTYAAPEEINAYELGLKSEFFNRHLRVNGALFQYDYKNQQFEDVEGVSSFLVNAGKSRVRGVELETLIAPVPRLTLSLNGLYLDAKYLELSLQGTDLSGNQMISSPKWSGTAAVDYTMPVNRDFDLSLHVDASYRSRQWFSAFNDKLNYGNIGQKGYGLVNGRLTLAKRDGLSFSLWAKNIFDKLYVSYAINIQSAFGMDYLMDGPPRTFGGEISYKF